MKRISIINLKTSNSVFKDCESDEIEQSFITSSLNDGIFYNTAEREILEGSESYEESDVLSRRTDTTEFGTINYVTLKAEYVITEEDITEAYNAEQSLLSKIANGKRCKDACEQVLQYVTGYNLDREFTSAQVTSFQTTFANIFSTLIASRPNTTRILIEAVSVDGTIVTQELKDNCLLILTRFGF